MPKKAKTSELTEETIQTPAEPPVDASVEPISPKKQVKIRPLDIAIFAVIGIVIFVLCATLISKLSLRHEVDAAKATATQIITDISKNDATGIRNLADKKFQADNTTAHLQDNIKAIAGIYGKTTPKIVNQVVSNTDKAQNVSFVYQYDLLKLPFYLRVDMTKPAGSNTWQLQYLSANVDKTKLYVN